MKNPIQQPDGIVITISMQMLKEKGYKNWLHNFLSAMQKDEATYWMKQGAKPKHDFLYVYLCIGGKIRYRCNFVSADSGLKKFDDGKQMYSKVWIVVSGPVLKAPHNIPWKGFRGFRYTKKLF